MKRLILAAIVAAGILAAPATASAQDGIMDGCGKSSDRWSVWVDSEDAVCGYADDAYRMARRYRSAHGIWNGQRFTLNMGAGIRLRMRVREEFSRTAIRRRSDGVLVAVDLFRWVVEGRESGHGVETEFDSPEHS